MVFWSVNIILWFIIGCSLYRLWKADKKNSVELVQKEDHIPSYNCKVPSKKNSYSYCRKHNNSSLDEYS